MASDSREPLTCRSFGRTSKGRMTMYQIKAQHGYEIQVLQSGENGRCRVEKATTATLRRRVFTVPGRLVNSGRRRHLRLPASWPWAHAIEQVLQQIHAIQLRC